MQRLLFWIPAALVVLGCHAPELAPEGETLKDLSFRVAPIGVADGASLRGVSAPGDDVVWASGSQGVVLRSLDRGILFRRVDPPGASELDFRMLWAFDDQHAWAGSAGPGAASRLFETLDGGKTWAERLVNQDPEGFWDALAFWDEQHGVLVGDAVDGFLTVMVTDDGGKTWARVPESALPESPSMIPLLALAADSADSASSPEAFGEVCFAASNRSLALGADGLAWIGTGGSVARVWRSADWGRTWVAADTPLRQGNPAAGVFAVAFRDALHGVVVGGNYEAPNDGEKSAAWTADGGASWRLMKGQPAGYRSAVAPLVGGKSGWIAVGTSGVSLAHRDVGPWTNLPSQALNAISVDPGGQHAYAVGPRGHFALMVLD